MKRRVAGGRRESGSQKIMLLERIVSIELLWCCLTGGERREEGVDDEMTPQAGGIGGTRPSG
jgi:hypothetical protein